MKPIFTQAQIDVLNKVHKELSEHFQSHVLVVYGESEDCQREVTNTVFHGGALMARAMMYEGIEYIREKTKTPLEDSEED